MTGAILVAVLLAVVAAICLIPFRPAGLPTADALVVLACLMLPWSAVEVHGIPIGDLPLGAGLLLSAVGRLRARPRVPAPVAIGVGLITLSGVVTSLLPPSHRYLAGRYNPPALLAGTIGGVARSTGDLLSLGKYEASILVLSLALFTARRPARDFLQLCAAAWVVGILISGSVALADHVHVSHLNVSLVGYVNITGREGGLTSQPNNVGVQIAMALPLVVYGIVSARMTVVRVLSAVGAVLCIGSSYVAGSRGGLLGLVLALVVLAAYVPRLRRPRVVVGSGIVVAGALGLLLLVGGSALLGRLRLNARASDVAASDSQRESLLRQGLHDAAHSPVHGIGFGYADQAHDIFLQTVAGGGVLFLVGFLLIVGTVLVRQRGLGGDPLSRALAASVTVWLVVGLIENQLLDQFLYVPLWCLLGLEIYALSEEPQASLTVRD